MVNNSDYDMFEQIYENANYNTAIKEITKNFQKLVRGIMAPKNIYIADIKAGLDHDLDYAFAHLDGKQIVGYEPKKLDEFLTNAYKKQYIDQDTYKQGRALLLSKLSLKDYYELKEYLRKLKTIRWTPEEILKGEKRLSGDRKKQLFEAIQDKTLIKIDIITPINNRLVEFSNIYEFYARNQPINAQNLDYVKGIKDEILMLHTYGKYAKMDKRILLLARFTNDEALTEKLTGFYNGSVGLLGKIKGDIEAIVTLLEKFPEHLPWATIQASLDGMRERIGNVYEFKMKSDVIDEELLHLSTMPHSAHNRQHMLETLETIIDYIGDILNKNALAFNKKNGLEPLPNKYL